MTAPAKLSSVARAGGRLMSRALVVTALCSALLGLGAVPARAARLGPFCFSLVPAQSVVPFAVSFPPLTLELFVDSEPYGQVFLGTARTLNRHDTPSFVTLQAVGRFVRVSIVGTSFQKPDFSVGGEIDTEAVPPSGPVEITATVGAASILDAAAVGRVPASMVMIPCP